MNSILWLGSAVRLYVSVIGFPKGALGWQILKLVKFFLLSAIDPSVNYNQHMYS